MLPWEIYTPSCQSKRLYVLYFWVICCKNIHECCRMTQNVWQTDLMYRKTAQKCVLFNSGEIIWISWVLCPCFIMHIVEAAAKSRRKIRQTTRVPGSLEISLVWAVTHAARRHTAHTHAACVLSVRELIWWLFLAKKNCDNPRAPTCAV